MDVRTPLDHVFATGSHVRVLRTLFRSTEGIALSARDVARQSGVSHPTVLRVMPILLEQGITNVTRRVRLDLYELNRAHVLAPTFEELFEAEAVLFDGFLGFLAESIRRQAPGVREAYVFGSAAGGEMGGSSDVDLAVIVADRCDPSGDLETLTDEVRSRYGTRLSVTVGHGDLVALSRSGRAGFRLWRKIAQEGIPLFTRSPAEA